MTRRKQVLTPPSERPLPLPPRTLHLNYQVGLRLLETKLMFERTLRRKLTYQKFLILLMDSYN